VTSRTAAIVRLARDNGDRILAIGTTAVRALESSVDASGEVRASRGWTDLVVSPDRGVRVIDGLLTGFHEPQASHLQMLEAIAGAPLLERCYGAALREGYLFHEFGDVNLLLP
jgi:S-adenosylmethionine:tRNA ribosyltransferase-isomerase